MAKKIRTAAVIGGGIAGPVTAAALCRAGIEATVYDAYPGPAEGLGGTLALAPNGLAALDIVGAAEGVRRIGLPLGRMAMSIGERRRFTLPHPDDIGPLQLVHRAELHEVLRDAATAAGVRFVYGKRLTGASEEPDRVTARFADGTTATAAVLIGADGVHSTVRGLIDPAAPTADYTGYLGFEAVSDHEVPDEPGTMTFAFGSRAYYLYWREPGGGTRWGMNLPWPTAMSSVEARAKGDAEWLRILRDVYGDESPGGALVRSIRPGSLHGVGGVHILMRVPRWHRGRMVLVGDAVHVPSNSSGQGASLAIESGVQVARCLRDIDDVGEAFRVYERLRRSRVEGVAARAARINRRKAPGRVARAMMPLLMPMLVRTAMNPEKTTAPEQRYRIDWATPVTT
ncbi:2-polyprenyl-6-methoxyphenol hydroxylase-like FAD-dependent oxidoreductase [Stackebrandtia albiflava]|uniref:2-polyprenyl-6-methoxyphenol hydroxylase-like FAD-dependent oxidoreductase n=1 Tax=Stackebrandtia albiflava TaxID=406432 RepID=A0A562V291_9ACTN|nr:NAD(P)/FAD-dependent oxidoreductase [Stackebrandtia albiflava]TWJ11955.1 2-polyprenyl-6-methoxyphenol hydroxylase-like FAD-dependent oxidoreductase [Stackebrandtia albiflava]